MLVALEMGIMHFTVNGETRNVLVGDGIAEVTPAYVMLLVDSAERPEDIDKNRAEAARIRAEESISRACTYYRARSPWIVPCTVCRPAQKKNGKGATLIPKKKNPPVQGNCMGRFFLSVSDAKIVSQSHFFGIVMRAAVPYARTSSRRKAAMPEGTSSPARRCS